MGRMVGLLVIVLVEVVAVFELTPTLVLAMFVTMSSGRGDEDEIGDSYVMSGTSKNTAAILMSCRESVDR